MNKSCHTCNVFYTCKIEKVVSELIDTTEWHCSEHQNNENCGNCIEKVVTFGEQWCALSGEDCTDSDTCNSWRRNNEP
jgi:hypothetical protein